MTIRRATIEDVPAVLGLAEQFAVTHPLAQAFPVSPVRVSHLVQTAVTSPNAVLFVAEVEGQVVGQVGAMVFDHPMLSCVMASIVTWWVDPAHRGAIGVSLWRALMAWATEQGADVVQMSARDESGVGELCRALGFEASELSWTRRV